METTGSKIRQRRKLAGLNQADLATAVQVSGATISSWESDRYSPKGKNLIALCAALRCSPTDLMSGHQRPGKNQIARQRLQQIFDEIILNLSAEDFSSLEALLQLYGREKPPKK